MGFIKINNRKNFIIDHIPDHHPDSLKYETWWKMQKRRCIEGYWGPDDENISVDVSGTIDHKAIKSEKWRFMTPHLYTYINFGTILHNKEGEFIEAAKAPMRPVLRDLEWEIMYNWFEAKGFSGFELDDEVSCNRNLKAFTDGDTDVVLPKEVIRKDGSLKEYKPVRDYLRQLFPKPLGLPLYGNQALNLFLMGSRGLGKSFTVASIINHDVWFDGTRRYDSNYLENPPKAEVFVGAALSSKSAELLEKVVLSNEHAPGKWKKNTSDEIAAPFSRVMVGSLEPNNHKNPWRYEYEEKLDSGKWVKKGTNTSVKHGIYTIQNPEAAAGGRYGTMIIEEVGLLPNVLQVHGSNVPTMTEGTIKFGSAFYIGTGGSIEKVVESEIIFRNPEGYEMVPFDDEWEGTGKIGFFIPAYYALNQFKDANGNTNEEAALKYLLKVRALKSKNTDIKAIQLEMMNRPIKPSEMFLSANGNFFPVRDLKAHRGELETDELLLASSWKGEMLISEDKGVYFSSTSKPVIRAFPLLRGQDTDGSVEIFEMPRRDMEGNIPYGRYISGLDPVDDDDNSNTALSLQSFIILDTFTDRIVCEYTARTKYVEDYYEQVRRLLLFYNATVNYENQKKGVYGYFKNKNCLHLFAETPRILKENKFSNISSVGNKSYGTTASDAINRYGRDLIYSWLNRQASNRDEGILNLHTIRSIAMLKELEAWNPDLNADRVSALIMLMIFREDVIRYIEVARRGTTKNKNKAFFDSLYNKNKTR
jgi:hypothetical protein